jgi:hypothetical protein
MSGCIDDKRAQEPNLEESSEKIISPPKRRDHHISQPGTEYPFDMSYMDTVLRLFLSSGMG